MITSDHSKVCACNLPRRDCIRYLQVDFVRNNGLPCRHPKTKEEVEWYANEKKRRRQNFIREIIGLAIYYLIASFLLSVLALVIYIAFSGRLP